LLGSLLVLIENRVDNAELIVCVCIRSARREQRFEMRLRLLGLSAFR
jgi:hypothetical protein